MTGGSECSAKDVMEVVCWGKGERMFRSPEMQFSGAYAKWGLSDEAGDEAAVGVHPVFLLSRNELDCTGWDLIMQSFHLTNSACAVAQERTN